MTIIVVDNSVVVKFYVPEEFEELAARLLHPAYEMHAPDHLPAEFVNAIWTKMRRRALSAEMAEVVMARCVDERLRLHSSLEMLPDALSLAYRHDRTVYDALYVVLARRLDARFVTADRSLYNSLAHAYPETMLWIEDVPGEGDEPPT